MTDFRKLETAVMERLDSLPNVEATAEGKFANAFRKLALQTVIIALQEYEKMQRQ